MSARGLDEQAVREEPCEAVLASLGSSGERVLPIPLQRAAYLSRSDVSRFPAMEFSSDGMHSFRIVRSLNVCTEITQRKAADSPAKTTACYECFSLSLGGISHMHCAIRRQILFLHGEAAVYQTGGQIVFSKIRWVFISKTEGCEFFSFSAIIESLHCINFTAEWVTK